MGTDVYVQCSKTRESNPQVRKTRGEDPISLARPLDNLDEATGSQPLDDCARRGFERGRRSDGSRLVIWSTAFPPLEAKPNLDECASPIGRTT